MPVFCREIRWYMDIEKAEINDHHELTKLTLRSKAHWGYPAEQIKKWEKELTITPKYIAENKVFKLCIQGYIIGYYSYFKTEKNPVKLDNLFIAPEYIGMGFGKILMADFF
ncbi:MAG TPA: N-acetyltransferase [Bacteroidetes bacterium]|nr:N-acetyltransferase [Bacteroidota bacterium]